MKKETTKSIKICRTEKEISEILLRHLAPYGAIKWHKNRNHSFYIKFRDVRLGSIRIANHKGRQRYRYTYEIYRDDKNVDKKIKAVISSIQKKSETIPAFDAGKYVVYLQENRSYQEVPTFTDYKNHILKN